MNSTPQNTPSIAGLPHSREAEQAVLGTILATPSSVFGHTDKLIPEYFFDPQHRIIVSAMRELVAENTPADVTLVYGKLREKGDNLKAGDLEGVRRLLEFNARPELLGYWLDEVKKYWELRLVIEACAEIVGRGKKVAGANVEEFLSYAESKFVQLAESRITTGLIPSSSVVKDTILDLEKLFQNPGKVTGVPSGFVDLDRITAGFQPSDLIILAARPAMGKTSLALNFAANAVFLHQKSVAFFSLEMSNSQLMQRMLATAAKIESHKFRDGKMTSEELARLYPEAASFQTDKLLLDDSPGISIIDLASRCRKVKRERGYLDLIIVDYLQLMSAGAAHGKASQNREREISIISMGLKSLAKELNCPVIALSQLNRGLEQRPDKRPRPSDLRESGSIEQDADQIMFVYRDEVYNKDTTEKGIAEIIIGKNRHGAIDTVKLAFQNSFTSFHNLARFDS
ncbi:replicative DNA helicase [Fluviispira multicolorata]|uniref:Replicative DNA helicase n=1 Tax=Fluviispira multicolorata TaxID=2654512 RepID=A0A833JEY7_9BACT|nr:replicative DNA helicase [Fluviispira multicolorata]KAB8030704.1 replicative DNA helicase [Fluviispira multicolorata]